MIDVIITALKRGEDMAGKFSLDGVIYKIHNGEAFVYGLTHPNSTNSVVIPSHIQTYPVTEIKHKAFYESNIKTITLPNSIIAIDESAFEECQKLVSVIQVGAYSTRAISINGYAFRKCVKLRNLVLKHDMLLLGQRQFAFCKSLQTLPNIISVSSFFDGTFYNCEKLTELEFVGPNNLLIDNNTFSNCPNLKKFTFRCKVKMNQYLLRELQNAIIFVEDKNKAMLDMAYLGYNVNVIPDRNI